MYTISKAYEYIDVMEINIQLKKLLQEFKAAASDCQMAKAQITQWPWPADLDPGEEFIRTATDLDRIERDIFKLLNLELNQETGGTIGERMLKSE